MKFKCKWVANLWEVGDPIKAEARGIDADLRQAVCDLDTARLQYRESLAEIKGRQARLEAEIGKLWSAAEIRAARKEK